MEAHDRRMLMAAARAAVRGEGRVEPNPLVGCVIAGRGGGAFAIGHHRAFGGPHAEVDALRACARLGIDPRGGTAWVTLEPCGHFGRTPPCADALIAAGVARVVIARRDPNPVSAGGDQRMRAAGIAVEFVDGPRAALSLADPFVKRIETGMPWVIAKWAQTIDGRIATRAGESKWISGERSRRMVHLWRGRVDAVVTGIGTVVADDPMLTARGVPVRRMARRVVIDARAEMPVGSNLVRSAGEIPTVVCVLAGAGVGVESRSEALRARGCEVVACAAEPGSPGRIDVAGALRELARGHGVASVLVEAGPVLLGSMVRWRLIDEARVFVAPVVLADAGARSAAEGSVVERLADGARLSLHGVKQVGGDALLWYRAEAR